MLLKTQEYVRKGKETLLLILSFDSCAQQSSHYTIIH